VAWHGHVLPTNPEHLHILLDAYLLEKAFYELAYELNSRPEWVQAPLQGMIQLLETGMASAAS
jgi:maltose alpha-D-glucosyltransferase/alpha-amylase